MLDPVVHTSPAGPTRANAGFELAKASQRWNELLYEEFRRRGFGEVRPSYGSVLLPLFEEDGLRMGELAARARVSKQTMTTLIRLMERARLVTREPDPVDRRASLIRLSGRALEFAPVAGEIVAELEQTIAAQLGERRYEVFRNALQEVMDLEQPGNQP
jgi:DNA-binding MarR family transcriptional regulator